MRTQIRRHYPLHKKMLISVLVLYSVFVFLPTMSYLQSGAFVSKDMFNNKLEEQIDNADLNQQAKTHTNSIGNGSLTKTPKTAANKPQPTKNTEQKASSKPNNTPATTGSSPSSAGKSPASNNSTSAQAGAMPGGAKPGGTQSSGNPATTKPVPGKNEAAPTQSSAPKSNGKVAYLTFDDGPTPAITPKILDALAKYDIKATFFVLGELAQANPALLKRQRDEGHYIANHTYSHRYQSIYSSPAALINELNKSEAIFSSILGKDYSSRLMRFPGGSFGDRLKPFREAVRKAGYSYLDWNALNGDSEALNVPAAKLHENMVKTIAGKNEAVILMHDSPGKETTIQALPGILEYLKSQGYTFATLENYSSLDVSIMNK